MLLFASNKAQSAASVLESNPSPASKMLRPWCLGRPFVRRMGAFLQVSGLALCLSLLAAGLAIAQEPGGSWATVAGPTNLASDFRGGTMFLLTDGTVMIQQETTGEYGTQQWFKLTPDANGQYTTGTWSRLADMATARKYYASTVLRDGKVFIAGGEYVGTQLVWTNASEIYDPVANSWASITPQNIFTSNHIGDAPCELLSDGRVLLGSDYDQQTAIYDPIFNKWTSSGSKVYTNSDEESWTLLPDRSILTVDCSNASSIAANNTERYIPSSDTWISAGTLPGSASNLVDPSSSEIGPSLLLPDGRAFYIGATGNTAFYTPSSNTWTSGPVLPNSYTAEDAAACLEPNGKILCNVGTRYVTANNAVISKSSAFYEFDPNTGTYTTIPNPPNNSTYTYEGRMLLLPNGQILYASESQSSLAIYTPSGTPAPAWRPTIEAITTG